MQENQAKEKDTMSKTEAYIDKSRRVCTLSKNIIDMLVKQLGAELSNMHIYRTFANYYGTNGLPSLEEYYLKRAEEEYLHHSWIYWYLSYCDATFQYPQIDAVNINIASNEYPFLATVDREIETTMRINEIVSAAFAEKDWTTFNWLNGDSEEHGRLVLEQNEEESLTRTIYDMATAPNSDWLIKQDEILDFYNDQRK